MKSEHYIIRLRSKRLPANTNSMHTDTAALFVPGSLLVVAAGCSVIVDVASVLAVGCTVRMERFFVLPANVTSISTEKAYCKLESVGTVKKSAAKSMLKDAVSVDEETAEIISLATPPPNVYKLVGVPWSSTEMLNNSSVAIVA